MTYYILRYKLISFKKFRSASMFAPWKSSARDETLKNLRRVSVKSVQSSKMCLTVKSLSQGIHLGRGSLLSKYECVSRVCPMRSRLRTTSSRRTFLKPGVHSPKVALIACSLLSTAHPNGTA